MGKENENEQFLHDYGQPCLISYVLCSRLWGRKRGYLFAFLIFCFDLYLLMISGYHQAAINRAIGKKWNLIVRQ
jgi:hypothetical protein